MPICGNHCLSAPVKPHQEIPIRLTQYHISIFRTLEYIFTVILAKAEVRLNPAKLNMQVLCMQQNDIAFRYFTLIEVEIDALCRDSNLR